MTACVNRKHSRRVAAVISASLVGALSLGVAPVAAMANDNIDMLEATPESSAQDGKIIEFEDGFENGATFVAEEKNGTPVGKGLVPTLVQPWATPDKQLEVTDYVIYKLVDKNDTNAQASDDPASDATTQMRTIDGKAFYFDKTFNTDGKMTKAEGLPSDIGSYAVFAKVKDTNGVVQSVKAGATFSIAAADLSKATLFQVNPDDPTSVADTDYVFNLGTADRGVWCLTNKDTDDYDKTANYNRLALAIGDDQLEMADFTFDYYTAKGTEINASDIKAAGDYYVIVSSSDGSIYHGAKQRFDFTIKPLDLSTANIVADDVEWDAVDGDTTTDVYVDGAELSSSWLNTYVTVDYPDVATKIGPASLTVDVNDKALEGAGYAGSIVESQTVNYSVVNHVVTPDASYKGKDFSTYAHGNSLKVNFSMDPTNEFDPSKVTVSYVDPDNSETVETDSYTLRVVNEETQEVGGVELLSAKGDYTVQAVLDSEALGYDVAGKSAEMHVHVTKGDISDTDIAFAYKGVEVKNGVVNSTYLPDYNVLSDIAVAVKTDNGKELDPSEYTLTVTNEEGDEVDEIVDAGEYTLQVDAEGYTYASADARITVKVAQRDLGTVDIRPVDRFDYKKWNDTDLVWEDAYFVRYTGEEIAPSYEWSADGGKTWYALPAEDFNADYRPDGLTEKDVLLETGVYAADINADKDSVNYTGKGYDTIEVSDARVYNDVLNTHWAAQDIYTANFNGWMNGYGDSMVFGADDSIKRGDVAVVLWKMAGKPSISKDEDSYDEHSGYKTGFDDVDGTMYYAEAIAWAKRSGIVSGDTGTGKFRPEDTISRQELAKMLTVYADLCKTDVTVDADEILSGYEDAGTVDEWARDYVAYLVTAGVMGQDSPLRGRDEITRAEVATMVVRLNEGIDFDLIPGIKR